MQLLLDTNGLTVKKRNQSFWVSKGKVHRMIHPNKVTSIAVTADCLISSSAIKLAAEFEIPIFFYNRAAKVEARLWGPNFGNMAKIRRQQILFERKPEATEWVIRLFFLKSYHQKANLQYLKRRRRSLTPEINKTIKEADQQVKKFHRFKGKLLKENRNSIMGYEGIIAKNYWKLISSCMYQSYQFDTRSRRPALDMFNGGLNYLYGMLYNLVASAVYAAGLDTQLGFLHTDQYNKPTFVFDLIEPFRPWVDRLMIELCLDKKVKMDHFIIKEKNGYFLSKKGKRFFIPLFEGYMEGQIRFNHHYLSRKNHIYRFAGEFSQFLLAKEF